MRRYFQLHLVTLSSFRGELGVLGEIKLILCCDLKGWTGSERSGYKLVLVQYGKYVNETVNEAGKFILELI